MMRDGDEGIEGRRVIMKRERSEEELEEIMMRLRARTVTIPDARW